MYSIYKHENMLNHKVYIGITKRDPKIRWGKNGIGYREQPKFFNAILKYGWNNFTHSILEEVNIETEALDREKYYISYFDSINNGYNVASQGCKDMSSKKKVYCLTTETLYDSITEAAIKNNISSAYDIIRNCKDQNSGTKGLLWTYWDEEKQCPMERTFLFKSNKEKSMTPVYCIELDYTTQSVKDMSILLNIEYGGIEKSVIGNRNGAGGFHFIYDNLRNNKSIEDLLMILQKKTGKQRPIICLDNKKIFLSGQSASIFSNISAQSVMLNCQGKRKHANNYHFMYLDDYIRNNLTKDTLELIQRNYKEIYDF